ncbi:caspase-8 [Venturia canescens]|uniref:caspase-8 n=1 Tax=Venturia canescens TaxID=32260 RepID=UPI001C9CAAF4|nr:caspase-8 [Venturia canescens]
MSVLHKSSCTDALLHKTTMKCIEGSTTLNAKILEKVEKQLEEFERISILFLISADDPDARCKIHSYFSNLKDKSNIIGRFVQNNFDLWSEKLLEALCIIKNKEVLRNLGFSPDHIIKKFLCNVGTYACNIHPISKALYNLFEALDSRKGKLLLECVYNDGIKRHYQDHFYLELHALQWIDANYITVLPGGGGNLNNLLKHLKKIDCVRAIYLDIENFSEPQESRNVCLAEKKCSSNALVSVGDSVSNETMHEHSTAKYTIKRGKCLIINEENFHGNVENQYEKREGSRKDGENIQWTFTRMGFDVTILNDLTEQQIKEVLKKQSKDFEHQNYDCLIVVILSHGFEGGIVSADSQEVPIKVIEDSVCTVNLRDVIKILIVQACQGKVLGDVSQNSELALDGPSDGSRNISRFRNFAIFMSTMNGFSAIRHKEEGSWFIQAICEVLSTGESLSVSEWQTRVINIVQEKVGRVNDCRTTSQIPEFKTRLNTQVYFPRYKEESGKKEEEKAGDMVAYFPCTKNMQPLQASVLDLLKNY